MKGKYNMTTSQDDYKQNLSAKHASKSGLIGIINANCIDCTYEPNDVVLWRKQAENCRGYSCSLYSVRPTTILSNTK
jgi:hypothetical protein